MRRDCIQARIYEGIKINGRKKWPGKSIYEITKELNKILEEQLYGIKPKG